MPLPDEETEEEVEEEVPEAVAFQAAEPGQEPATTDGNPPAAALQKIVSVPLSPVPGQVTFTEQDITQAVARLRDVLPEVFEETEA